MIQLSGQGQQVKVCPVIIILAFLLIDDHGTMEVTAFLDNFLRLPFLSDIFVNDQLISILGHWYLAISNQTATVAHKLHPNTVGSWLQT